MKLEINVDETMFKDVLENELKAFSKEELHKILKDCIVEFFRTNDNIKDMFLQEKSSYWGGERHHEGYEPTGLLREIVKEKFNFNKPYDEVSKTIIDFCEKEDTMKTILKEMIADAFKSAFTGQILYNPEIRGTISRMVYESIMDSPQIPKIQ